MGATASSHQISPEPQPNGEENPSPLPSNTLSFEERAILWEVHLAQRCVGNFSNIINAFAIVMSLLVAVTFVGVLQPPKGWNVDSRDPQNPKSYMFASSAVLWFTVFNSLSLYSAISGLLLYLYCSYSTIFTLGSVPLPERFDELGKTLLRRLRCALRQVALPNVKRRSTILFCFLAASLLCCVAAYISAGLAAIDPSSVAFVIAPAILGCIVIIFLLVLAYAKMSLELKFDERLKEFWTIMGETEIKMNDVNEETRHAVDPTPGIIRLFFK